MNRVHLSILTAAILTGMSFAQTSAETQASGSVSQDSSVQADRSGAQVQSQSGAQAASQNAVSSQSGKRSGQAGISNQQSAGSTVHATLVKPVDARKNKPGDEVVAKTTQDMKANGETVIPKGSKIVGHVTEAKARSAGQSQSSMGIAFDHAVLKDGREVPLTASIQAISSAQQATAADFGDESLATGSSGMATASSGVAAGRGAAGGLVGGTGAAIGATGTLVNTAGAVGHTGGAGLNGATSSALSSSSQGVIGMRGLSLSPVAASATGANSTQGSLITSPTQNVHLDSGTQMILQVAGK